MKKKLKEFLTNVFVIIVLAGCGHWLFTEMFGDVFEYIEVMK